MARLTKRIADAERPGGRDRILFDDELPCFALRVKPSGARSWLVQYRNAQGRSRKLTLGRYPATTAEEARRRALSTLAAVQGGADPAERKKAALREPTVTEFAAEYLARHAEPKKKPASLRNDRAMFANHVLPKLGALKLSAVNPRDVARLHHAIGETAPIAANRVAALLSKMFNLAARWGALPPGHPNPVHGLERFRERKVQRALTLDEVRRLGATLAAAERERTELPGALLATRLLMLTGCRMSEILRLRWDDVDVAGAALVLRDSKTGERRVPLGAAAVQVLAEARERAGDTSEWVCPGKDAGRPLVGLFKAFARIRRRAGLEDVRVHDLRHAFASLGVDTGFGLPVVGAILGHRESRTTARYAHVGRTAAHEAADRIAGTLAAALDGRPSAQVTALRTLTA
jgi:integrase